MWNAEKLNGQSVRFWRVSPDGEEGYPGRVEVSVTYSVSTDNAFTVDVEAATDAATPITLTHHSYFNLAGEASGESVDTHELEIFADDFAPADAHMGLMGMRQAVNAGNDFRHRRLLSEAISQLQWRHGDLYFLRGEYRTSRTRIGGATGTRCERSCAECVHDGAMRSNVHRRRFGRHLHWQVGKNVRQARGPLSGMRRISGRCEYAGDGRYHIATRTEGVSTHHLRLFNGVAGKSHGRTPESIPHGFESRT